MTESPLPFQFGADPEAFRVSDNTGEHTGDTYDATMPDVGGEAFTNAATGEQPKVNETPRDERGDSARWHDGRWTYP